MAIIKPMEIAFDDMKTYYNRYLRVYSDWTRRRKFGGVKHVALVLEHMLMNQSFHNGRAAF